MIIKHSHQPTIKANQTLPTNQAFVTSQALKANIVKALVTMSLMFMGSQAMAGSSVNSILKQYYPTKYKGCMGVIVDDTGYCMQIDKQKTVDTKYGKRHYVVVSGTASFDKTYQEMAGYHAINGLVGMFVLKPDGNGWKIESAKAKMYAGSYGNGLKKWTLHRFATNTWGFLNEHSDAHQGFSGSHFVILTPNGRGGIDESWIGASFNDDSGLSECGERGKPVCDSIGATIKINRSRKVNGRYPLDLTVTGVMNGKKYNHKTYQAVYSKQGYQMPKNYPLEDIDY